MDSILKIDPPGEALSTTIDATTTSLQAMLRGAAGGLVVVPTTATTTATATTTTATTTDDDDTWGRGLYPPSPPHVGLWRITCITKSILAMRGRTRAAVAVERWRMQARGLGEKLANVLTY